MDDKSKKALNKHYCSGENKNNFGFSDYAEPAAINGWYCARDKERSEAFRDYKHNEINHSEYNLNGSDMIASIQLS
ncbi:MAG: hypothetical protein J6J93_03445 [Muribaculaceae bacterium]|nr:hypothetical protein [Muribaculaceae bacterium]